LHALLLLPTERGQVGIFDATNSTQERRQKLVSKNWGMGGQIPALGEGGTDGQRAVCQGEGFSRLAGIVFHHEGQRLVCSRSSVHEAAWG